MRSLHWAVRVQVGGRPLLLPTPDLREVVPIGRVTPFPSPTPNLQGVMVHQGELLPLFQWPQGQGHRMAPTQVAVLRFRLGLPLDLVDRVMDLRTLPVEPPFSEDPWEALIGCVIHENQGEEPGLAVLDVEKLLGMLHNRSLRR